MFCFGQKVNLKFLAFPPNLELKCARAAPGNFLLTSLHSNSLNPTMTVTTPLQGDLYSMGCPDVLSSVAGCVTRPLSKAGPAVARLSLESLYRCQSAKTSLLSEQIWPGHMSTPLPRVAEIDRIASWVDRIVRCYKPYLCATNTIALTILIN